MQGDRPDRKHTPFVLKVLSSNLWEDSARDQHTVQFSVWKTSTQKMDDALVEDAAALSDAINNGVWDTAAGSVDIESERNQVA